MHNAVYPLLVRPPLPAYHCPHALHTEAQRSLTSPWQPCLAKRANYGPQLSDKSVLGTKSRNDSDPGDCLKSTAKVDWRWSLWKQEHLPGKWRERWVGFWCYKRWGTRKKGAMEEKKRLRCTAPWFQQSSKWHQTEVRAKANFPGGSYC